MPNLNEVREALDRGEFFLEYLPTVSLSSGHCLGAEALIRWRHSTRVIPPGEFIPVVENTFLSGLITYWVIERVMADLDEWLTANPGMYIGINIPPEVLGRGGVAYAVAKSGLVRHADQLMFEITERGVPDLLGISTLNIARSSSREMLALDDVTLMGDSHLAIFARSTFDAIKLDKSLIDQIDDEHADPEWLHTIAAIVTSSHLLVIAEGVETEQQMRRLQAANVPAAQGFYFSRPIDARTFMAFARDHGSSNSTPQ